MGVPHYTYMILKILGPKGVITVRGSLEHAVNCDRQSYDLGARPGKDESNTYRSSATAESAPRTKSSDNSGAARAKSRLPVPPQSEAK